MSVQNSYISLTTMPPRDLPLCVQIKHGDVAYTRALLERSTWMPMPLKKLRALFKKWLLWEESLGG